MRRPKGGQPVVSVDAYGAPYLGVPRVLTSPQPAAATDQLITLPGGAYYRPISLVCPLTTEVTAGNRFPNIQVDDGSSVFCLAEVMSGVVASSSVTIGGLWGAGQTSNSGWFKGASIALPPMILLPGSRIRVNVGGQKPADQLGVLSLYCEEIDLGPQGAPLGPFPNPDYLHRERGE